MYLVDSFYGETIDPVETLEWRPFDFSILPPDAAATGQVDFRYGNGDLALMMYLDGHVAPQRRWTTLNDLVGDPGDPEDHGRGVRIRQLTSR